jgi:uncharacterized repeat protein (TIGR03803 family)
MRNTRVWGLCGALVFALAIAVQAQTYSDIYNFGDVNKDAGFPLWSGIIAQGRDGNLYTTTPYGGTNNVGAAVKITPSGQETVLYNFNNSDSDEAFPFSGLSLGIDGNLYGATIGSLDSSMGKVFKITPNGQITFLHTFKYAEGYHPFAPPIQASDGNLYGTTSLGGANGKGTVYKITLSGQFGTIGSFNYTNGYYSNAPLVEGTDGNFYGTTWEGGSSGVGTVFQVTSKGKITTIHNFTWYDGAYPRAPLVQASDGNLYGVADGGGANAYGTVFKVTTKKKFTLLHSFSPSDGEYSSAGLVQGTDGNLYGVTSQSGSNSYGTIYRITTSGNFSVIHNFDYTHGSQPMVTLMQHTVGPIYGNTDNGGPHGYGTFFSLNANLPPFAKLVTFAGKVGTSIGILGQGFSGATGVSFNGTSATFNIVSDTFLSATVPDGATTGPVTVNMGGTKLVSNQKFLVTPTITSFSPTSGPVGTQVIISGVSLSQAMLVKFGTTAASFTVNNDKKVTATVPANAKSAEIMITTPGGIATSSLPFTVTP